MIAYNNDPFARRFNPMLGSFYDLCENPYKGMDTMQEEAKESNYMIRFVTSERYEQIWFLKTIEQAEQVIEWLDSVNNVQFIPHEILNPQQKQNETTPTI